MSEGELIKNNEAVDDDTITMSDAEKIAAMIAGVFHQLSGDRVEEIKSQGVIDGEQFDRETRRFLHVFYVIMLIITGTVIGLFIKGEIGILTHFVVGVVAFFAGFGTGRGK